MEMFPWQKSCQKGHLASHVGAKGRRLQALRTREMIICSLQHLGCITHLPIYLCTVSHTHFSIEEHHHHHPPLTSVFSGGLAERLSRLQSRQRSAVSFWRHRSAAAPATGEPHRPTFTPESQAPTCGSQYLIRVQEAPAVCGSSTEPRSDRKQPA